MKHIIQGFGSPIEVYERMWGDKKTRYAGADWLIPLLKERGRTISPFGIQVADLLGELYRGLYHAERAVLNKKVDWHADRRICVVVSGSMATCDDNGLTRLVLLSHDYCIRCEMEAATIGYLRLCFSPRQRDGNLYERHPTIDQAIAAFRGQQ